MNLKMLFQHFKDRLHKNLISKVMHASEHGDIRTVSKLLRKHPDLVNAKNEKMETPLHMASLHGQTLVVEYLLKNGADVNARSKSFYGITPIGLCYCEAYEQTRDIDIPVPIGRRSGHSIEIANILLKWGADPNSILYTACSLLDKDMVELLLKNGADVNLRRQDGNLVGIHTPFMKVVFLHYTEPDRVEDLLNLLLTWGASMDDSKGYYGTALHYAVTFDTAVSTVLPNLRLAKFLISKGANIDWKDQKGRTVLELVKEMMNKLKESAWWNIYHQKYETLVQIEAFLRDSQRK
jgi:ankyrin repeat protein